MGKEQMAKQGQDSIPGSFKEVRSSSEQDLFPGGWVTMYLYLFYLLYNFISWHVTFINAQHILFNPLYMVTSIMANVENLL